MNNKADTRLNNFEQELEGLIAAGDEIRKDLTERANTDKKDSISIFESLYQTWYTESHRVIEQLLPARLTEFEQLYLGVGRRSKLESPNYTIQDWLRGMRAGIAGTGRKRFDDFAVAGMAFINQLQILKSVRKRIESSLFDIRQVLQADLFNSELDGARELVSKGFFRAAGVIAGVVLESHLREVAGNRKLKSRKRNPAINDWNEILKSASVIDVPTWRNVQRLADLRNICAHSNEKTPSKDDVNELIQSVDKISRTVY